MREIPGVALTFATIGGGVQGIVNKATIHVELVDGPERNYSQTEAIIYARKVLKRWPTVSTAVEPISEIGGGGGRQSNVQYILSGNDLGEINRAADVVIAKLKETTGYVDVDKSSRDGKPELRIDIDRTRAADLGVPVADIAMTLRTLYAGQEATEIATDGKRIELIVRMQDDLRTDPARILTLRVRSRTTGELIPLSNLVTVEPSSGPSTIERFQRQRQVTVFANVENIALGTASEQVQAIAATVTSDTVTGSASGNSKQLAETIGYMLEALLLAMVLIYLILAAQFESFIHPLTIMLSLPLSLVGALGLLAFTGMPLSIFTMIGFIMLVGLVTKNAVLLVDYTNVLRRAGMERFDALVHAGVVRLRPILMTTAAMIFGMLPVALALSAGGEQRAPMAVAVIGGLITSTLLTLIVIPSAYLLLDKLTEKVKGWLGIAPDPEVEPALAE